MAKRTKAQRRARVKKAIQTFERMALGLVKIWLTNKQGVNSPYVVAVDQVDEFIKQFTEENL